MTTLEGACLGRRGLEGGCSQFRRAAVSRWLHQSSAQGGPDATPANVFQTSRRLPVEVDSETKTVKTVVGELPLSPLMDLAFFDARERFTRRKQREKPYSKKSTFRKLLELNPYAQALATPIRMCSVTKTPMPKFFLQQFRLVTHPETDETWWMAQNLKKWEPPAETEPNNKLDADKTCRESAGPSAYVLSSHGLLDSMQNKRSPYAGKQRGLMHQTIFASGAPIGQYLNKALWRHDMGPFLLEIMRRRVVEQLLYFADKVEKANRRYLIKCDSWDEVKQYNHRGCMLYFEGPVGTDTAVIPQLSAMSIEKRYNGTLAVHNMQQLLTEEHIQRLRAESTVLRDGSLFLLGRRPTIDLQLLLWKLQGYVSGGSAQ